ncbi:AraC family transcriptional regulator [Phaeobacter inhibens]|uniref:AraC-like ligand-binding domain-containing protein n=1 Tax=Phaeobacter inhibens TaxID=221822 RepID=UPI0027625FBA|nr:helix-turn-helix domain-containing protein [Phaeobacter inhibens]GLO70904.1 AraC family transcriptional regulator [Phaeobacter inhibens]
MHEHEQVWSTSRVAAGRAQDYWREAHSEAFFKMDLDVHRPEGFKASIRQKPIGPIRFSRLKLNSSQTLRRTRSDVATCKRYQFEFIVMTDGETQLEQDGRSFVLQAGDAALVDNRRAYSLTTSERSKNLVFHLPTDWMNQWIPTRNDRAIGVIHGTSPWGNVVQSITQAVAFQPSGALAANYHQCADQLAGAISVALTAKQDEDWQSRTDALFEHARNLLSERAHHPAFNVAQMAGALSISERYLHKVFSAQGTTFGAELLGIKLDRAARMLRNPNFGKVPIEEISWRAGFRDPSHFSRCFKTKFGITPGGYRGSVQS